MEPIYDKQFMLQEYQDVASTAIMTLILFAITYLYHNKKRNKS
jgi:hypothetical protein